jgi:hypothetical protein
VSFLKHIVEQYNQHSSEDQLYNYESGFDVANTLEISVGAGEERASCPDEVEENSKEFLEAIEKVSGLSGSEIEIDKVEAVQKLRKH